MAAFRKTQTLIFSIFLFFATTVATYAAEATFSWTANSETVSGYKIHYGTNSRNYTSVTEVGLPTAVNGSMVATVEGLQEGQTYYFAATAYLGTADSIIEESDYSDEVVHTVPGTATPQPPITNDVSLQGSEDTPLSGQLNASNSEGTTLTFTVVSQPSHGTVTVEDSSGSFTYTPAANYSSDDTFSYTAANSAGTSNQAIVTIHLSPVNDSPVANGSSITINEDGNYSGTLSATDIDGGNLVYSLAAQAHSGTTTISSDGSFTYTPGHDLFGSDSFTFTANDGSSTSNTATVNITINLVNDSPVANDSSITINENTSSSGQLSASDPEGSSLTYTLVAQAGKGTVSITTSGHFTYIPQHNISGSDSFTFKVSDGSITSNTAQVNITIQHVNIAPVAQVSSFSVDQGVPYSGQLVATDENADTLHFAIATAPEKGTVLISDNGSFTYTPNADASGADMFTFQATDGNLTSNKGTVTILINEVSNELAFELGELLVTSTWQHVDFRTEYTSPAVIAKSTTMNNPEAGLVSIRNLTNEGFDIRIREWDYADGVHPEEIVSFMAMEQGHHQIADNVYAVAECTGLSGLNTFQRVKFANSLSSQPVVLSSIVTENEANAAILRMKKITSYGFYITMQEQENNDGNHAEETVCYIAMEKWSGVVDGLMIETGTTIKILTDKASKISFKQQFPTIPFVLADMQSTNGTDTAIVGMSDLSVTDTRMTILEEQSADIEIKHTAEIGGYFAVAPYNPE